MGNKVGRNDPCPCGSGKKHKHCCMVTPGGKKKFSASVLTAQPKKIDLMERTYGNAISRTMNAEQAPPVPPPPPGVHEGQEDPLKL